MELTKVLLRFVWLWLWSRHLKWENARLKAAIKQQQKGTMINDRR